ncbi:hypothetical protein ANN_14462 [Periplaneta americana]|uniref:Uncharacterized protein n=1 Tax=Periplaneta americana TaxID=6978 RepID=A0ABQ8SXV6_PERAM|nr:hypothetical protein ANN_14462 [Periplaneta americana]
MAGLCEGGNEPPVSLKAIYLDLNRSRITFLLLCNVTFIGKSHGLNIRPLLHSRSQCWAVVSPSRKFSSIQYGMKINANKTKSMIIGREIKKINLRILNEPVEQVNSFKYFGCSISSNMSCCQEVTRRIAMAKEAYNRKRSIFCGPLGKELRKRCSVWSVALYGAETWTLRRSEEKRIESFEM